MDSSHWCFWEKRHIFQSKCSAKPFHSDIMWRHRYVSHGKKNLRDFHLNPGCSIGILVSVIVYEIITTYCFNGSFWVLETFCWVWYHLIPKKTSQDMVNSTRFFQTSIKNFRAKPNIPEKTFRICRGGDPETPAIGPPSVICFKGSGIPSTSSTLSSSSIDTQVLGAAGAFPPLWHVVMCCDGRVWIWCIHKSSGKLI